MPKPNPDESRSDFVSRCVQVVSAEEPDSKMDYRIAKCYGIYKLWKKKQRRGDGKD